MSFSRVYVERRTRRKKFFNEVNLLIDWSKIEKELLKVYKKGQSVDGRPSYSGLLLFKMLLVQQWYNVSDVELENMVNDSLSVMRFCGLELEDDVPDHSTISRFRKELTAKGAMDRLLKKINEQLKRKGVSEKEGKGTIVDATITQSPFRPKGKTEYQIAVDREEEDRSDEEKQKEEHHHKLLKKEQPGVDSEARWLKKGKELYYGYKMFISTDEDGIIESVHTTAANVHDSRGLEKVLEKVPDKKKKSVYADKGFKTPSNDAYLREQRIKNRIQRKAYRNRPLTAWEKVFNKLIGRYRYVVERTFGSIKLWFGSGKARYKGKEKVHFQHVMEAIAYNIKRARGLAWEKCIQ